MYNPVIQLPLAVFSEGRLNTPSHPLESSLETAHLPSLNFICCARVPLSSVCFCAVNHMSMLMLCVRICDCVSIVAIQCVCVCVCVCVCACVCVCEHMCMLAVCVHVYVCLLCMLSVFVHCSVMSVPMCATCVILLPISNQWEQVLQVRAVVPQVLYTQDLILMALPLTLPRLVATGLGVLVSYTLQPRTVIRDVINMWSTIIQNVHIYKSFKLQSNETKILQI